MNTKYLFASATWHFKKAGGLFLGLKINAPVRIWDGDHQYDSINSDVGVLFFTIHLGIRYAHKTINE